MIRFEVRGWVGLATIDREERRNALDAEHCDELRAALGEHPDLRAVVVGGAGRAFCAGADLVTRFEPAGGDGGNSDRFRPAFEQLLDAVAGFPAPVIAAVHGPAIGAGMQLAAACDLRVATPAARFGIPAGRLGVHLSASNIWRLHQLLGPGLARDLLLTGRTVGGEEAHALGFVERLVEEATTAALELAGEIAALAPLTVRGHKRALDLVAEAAALGPDARRAIDALEAAAFASDDLREGMAAFDEGRTPDFRGR